MEDDEKPRTISEDDYLKAFALFTMAAHHSDEAEKYNKALTVMLGQEQYSHISDEIFSGAGHDFNAALKKSGITVAPASAK